MGKPWENWKTHRKMVVEWDLIGIDRVFIGILVVNRKKTHRKMVVEWDIMVFNLLVNV